MIRTRMVEMTTMEAVAFRRKLRGGQTGLVIQPFGGDQPGLALIDKPTGDPRPAQNNPRGVYPDAAFAEATELTAGLPFTARGAVRLEVRRESAEEVEETPEETAAVSSAEYEAVVKAYTDKRGNLSYALLNKDFIQFAKGSKRVADMVAEGASPEAIRAHVVRVKLEGLTGNRNLTDAQIDAIVSMLEDANPRHVFRELNDELRRMLAR